MQKKDPHQSEGLVTVIDYNPETQIRALEYEDEFRGWLRTIVNNFPTIERIEANQVVLGDAEGFASLGAEQVSRMIAASYETFFLHGLTEFVKFHEKKGEPILTMGQIIYRTKSMGNASSQLESDRFVWVRYRHNETQFTYVIPIWHVTDHVVGENNFTKRKLAEDFLTEDFIFRFFMEKGSDGPRVLDKDGSCFVDEVVINFLQTTARILTQEENEWPVAAATYLNNKLFVVDRPNRHHDIAQSTEYHAHLDISGDEECVQGFVTNHGNFVNRYRAAHMAFRFRCFTDPTTYSVKAKPIAVLLTEDTETRPMHVYRHRGIVQEDDIIVNHPVSFYVCDFALFSEDLF
jgi:hypothetical protein